MKKLHNIQSRWLAIVLSLIISLSVIPSITHAESLQMKVECKPSSVAIQGGFVSIFVTTNENTILHIQASIGDRLFSLFTNIPLEKSLEKEIRLPIVYPLDRNFTLHVRADNIQKESSLQENINFTVTESKKGIYSLEGRIINGSYVHKTGLEGAFIEVVSGETYTYTETDDDGYFTLNHLLEGPYKIQVSHSCTKATQEFITEVNSNTEFAYITLYPHKIPDFDFWMNKSVYSDYEKGETATIYIRSRLNMIVDLYIQTKTEKVPVLLNFHVKANALSRFYWTVPESLPLGPLTFSLEPSESEYCGTAKYTIQITNSIQKGSLQGKVVVDGKPIQGAKVSFPYEFLPHTFTDEYGIFVLQNIPGGNYHLRCTMEGFEEYNQPYTDIIRGQNNGPITIDLEPQSPSQIIFSPSRLDFTTHERRERQIPILCHLSQGYIQNIQLQKKQGPVGINITPNTIPQLLQESQILVFTIENTVPPGEYEIQYDVVIDNKVLQELRGTVSVRSLSNGTFDGFISPPGNSIPQGGTAEYVFTAERFTNFRENLSLRFKNLPSYTQVIMDTEQEYIPPCSIPFAIDSSLSTEVKTHEIEVEVFSKTQKNVYRFPLTIFPRKGQLETCPEEGWDPILIAGETAGLSISCFSPNGHSENVRVNKDYGPDWISIPNRDIGTVTQNPISTQIQFSPPSDILVGGYPYSISFTYGENNEEFKKFTGQIHVLPHDPNAPVNARGKYIQEERNIIVTWNPPTDKQDQIIGYNIYRSLHYPALASAAPYNSTLLKDTEFLDTDFLHGQQYWYIVKAVYQDGSLSPASNTVQINIPPEKKGIVIVALDKPAGSSYYTNNPLSIHFQSSLSGRVSIVCSSGFIDITLLETFVTEGTRYHWSPILPSLPESKSMCTVYFESEGGYTHTQKFSFFATESKQGAASLFGTLKQQSTNQPIHGASVQIIQGPSYSTATTDADGVFVLKHLSPGSYQFSILHNGEIFAPYSCDIENGENRLDPIEIDPIQQSKWIAWSGEIDRNLLPLWIYAEKKDRVSLIWEKDNIQRVLYRHIELEPKQTTYMHLPIADDLPVGDMFLSIISESSTNQSKIAVTLPSPANHVYGYIKNVNGIPITNAQVNDYSVNEWGYFSILQSGQDIISLDVQAPFYQSRTISISEFDSNTSILLDSLTGYIEYAQKELFICKDFNTLQFQWISRKGWTDIIDFHIVQENEEDTKILAALPPFQCYPEMKYEFHFMNLLREQLEEGSVFLTWAYTSSETNEEILVKIPIKKGLPDKLFFSTRPTIPIFSDTNSIDLILDIYSYASRPDTFLLQSVLPSEYDSFIHPSELIPGNECSLEIRQKDASAPHEIILGSIEVTSKNNKNIVEVFPFHFQTQPSTSPTFLEPYWNQTMYSGSKVTHTFYLSQTPEQIEILKIPAFMTYQIWDNTVKIIIESTPEGINQVQIPILLNQTIETNLDIHIEGLPMPDHWNAPVLKASNDDKGILLQIDNLLDDTFYRVNKYQNGHKIEWQTGFKQDKTYLDTNVQANQTYTYQVFATNFQLESGWSNEIVQPYIHLYIHLKLEEITYTNKSSILLTGTATPETTLTLNKKNLPMDIYGRFSFNAPLEEGKNSFLFTIEDAFENTLSKEITVIRDSVPPQIEFVSPKAFPYYTKSEQLNLQLKTESQSVVTVNGVEFKEKTPGTYSGLISLAKGSNELRIIATDKASNQVIINVQCIRYEKGFFIQLRIGSSTATINGEKNTLDVPPQILQGRTVVPLRFISEAFGATVEWIAETKEITIQFGTTQIQLRIGSSTATINGEKNTLDVPPQILQGRTVVPLRFISEAFGATVEWIAETKEITIRLYM